ncbi:hypothetical protein ACL02R_16775 [Streptomyces sp. MS19]|uniref:hypothetical protein n=1 Tax=Streptomyces sp. MS19 TaxID=3385972 RepID=UPI00399F9B6F
MDSHKAAVAAGIAGGYLLGRRHKAKLALVVATYVAGRRFRLSPTGLAVAGLRRIQDNPQFAEATERLRGQVLDAGRTAAQERISALTDTLRERTEALGGALGSGDGADDEDREEEQGAGPERHDSHRHRDRSHRRRAQADDEDDAADAEEEDEAPEDREEPPQRKQRKKAAAAKAAHTKKAAGARKRAARSTSRSQRER